MSRFQGKVAVVTGAGSGIGRALAGELARRGARLALSDVDEATLDATAKRCRVLGAEVHTAQLDVSDREAMAAYASAVAAHVGTVHQLYNNAGVAGTAQPLTDTGYDVFDHVLGVNLWGVIYGSREFLPHLIASGDGHLVTISSLNGYMGQANMTAYCASKFGVRGFTEALRTEMIAAGHPVQVTVVHPGGVKTNISNAAFARAGELSPEDRRRAEHRTRVYNEQLFRTSADEAARIILDGVAARKTRVLVGSDAKAVDTLVRAFPALYSRVVAWWERRTFGDSA